MSVCMYCLAMYARPLEAAFLIKLIRLNGMEFGMRNISLEACSPRKPLKLDCSKVESEAI